MWFLSSLSCSFPSLSVPPCFEAPAVMLGCLTRDTRSFAPFQPHASLVASSQPFPHLSEPFASSHPWNSLSLSPSLMQCHSPFSSWWLTPSCVIIRALPLYNMFLFSLADKGGIWSEGYGVRLTEMWLRGGNLCSGPATLLWPHRSRSERPEAIQNQSHLLSTFNQAWPVTDIGSWLTGAHRLLVFPQELSYHQGQKKSYTTRNLLNSLVCMTLVFFSPSDHCL